MNCQSGCLIKRGSGWEVWPVLHRFVLTCILQNICMAGKGRLESCLSTSSPRGWSRGTSTLPSRKCATRSSNSAVQAGLSRWMGWARGRLPLPSTARSISNTAPTPPSAIRPEHPRHLQRHDPQPRSDRQDLRRTGPALERGTPRRPGRVLGKLSLPVNNTRPDSPAGVLIRSFL